MAKMVNNINISGTAGKVYDLDEFIRNKRNSETELLANVVTTGNETDAIIKNTVTNILKLYKIAYTEDNYTSQISLVDNFESIFDIEFANLYNKYIASKGEGNISIEEVKEKKTISSSEVGKFTLTDVSNNKNVFKDNYDNNKPIVIWTDGTHDTGANNNPSEIVYSSNLDDILKDMLVSTDNNTLNVIHDEENDKIILDTTNIATKQYVTDKISDVISDNLNEIVKDVETKVGTLETDLAELTEGTEAMAEVIAENKAALDTKLDKSTTHTDNFNKYLMTDSNGDIVFGELPEEVQELNTTIDTINDTIEDLDTRFTEFKDTFTDETKLNANLGVENAGKVLVVDDNGDVVTQDSTLGNGLTTSDGTEYSADEIIAAITRDWGDY